MQITITMRNQYGATVYHPACADSLLFARIAGTKTLTPAALSAIKCLGYLIVLQQENPAIIDTVI
jgi:hypothetical protein